MTLQVPSSIDSIGISSMESPENEPSPLFQNEQQENMKVFQLHLLAKFHKDRLI